MKPLLKLVQRHLAHKIALRKAHIDIITKRPCSARLHDADHQRLQALSSLQVNCQPASWSIRMCNGNCAYAHTRQMRDDHERMLAMLLAHRPEQAASVQPKRSRNRPLRRFEI